MDLIAYLFALGFVKFLQALPLSWVARLGRAIGALVYALDARHRRVAQQNLAASLPEKSAAEIRALARENFRRIGENFASAAKTASMTLDELRPHMEVVGAEKLGLNDTAGAGTSRIFAIGHFGNFEIFARTVQLVPDVRGATTYRALKGERLNGLLLSLREKNGCLFFERRKDGVALRTAIGQGRIYLGLLSDQHAGDSGLRLPFFGRDCSTTKAPAVFALRYNLPLHTSICYRTAPGRWRIEVGDAIPTHVDGHPRGTAEIMLDVNRAFEAAVHRDPANWFWVHKRWKPPRKTATAAKPAASLEAADPLETGDAT